MTYLALILIGILVFVLSLSMAFDWLPILTENIRMLFGTILSTISGLYLLINGIWKAAPDPAKELVAKILRQIPNLPNYYKRRTVGFEIESEINTALKEFSKEGAGFVEEEVVVKWLKPGEEARRLFFKGGKAFIKLDFTEDKERNLVEATLMYCKECLLPEVRQFIERPMMRAIDITFIDELLSRRNIIRGRAYFTQEVIPQEIKDTPGMDIYLDDLELINQHGLFTRAFLPELKEYPGKAQRRVSRKNHLQQIEEYVAFLKKTAEDRTRVVKRVWLHIGETIRVGVILVGTADKLEYEGVKPYVRRTAKDNAQGARTVYMIGYNLGNSFVPNIAHEIQQRGISKEYKIHEYYSLIGKVVKKHTLARLSIPEGSGAEFLRRYPSTKDWPDLEGETLRSVVKEKENKLEAMEETPVKEKTVNEKPMKDGWEKQLNNAWKKRANTAGQTIPGPVAGGDALKIFGVKKLKDGEYKTLQSILNGSAYLSKRWARKENTIVKL